MDPELNHDTLRQRHGTLRRHRRQHSNHYNTNTTALPPRAPPQWLTLDAEKGLDVILDTGLQQMRSARMPFRRSSTCCRTWRR